MTVDQNRQYLEFMPKDTLIEKVLELWSHREKLINYSDLLEKRLETLDPDFLEEVQEGTL